MTCFWACASVLVLCSLGLASQHCTANQTCWPSSDTWSSFNSSIDGRLVSPHPPAWPCHDPNYDELACNIAKANWNNAFWRSNQTGASQDPVWDSLLCEIDTPQNVTCEQGAVPVYSVAARDSSHVSKSVKFAGDHNLKLVVKNTGHDYLGRSSGEGSFSIWTHELKGINFTKSFIPVGCSEDSGHGVPTVTVGAGEQWADIYRAANNQNVTVSGGAARSVGAAGGWVQGGGHGPLSGLYGMGVDNVLEFTLVKPNGDIVKANSCQNKDVFWALRGGGGSTWGVTLDVTYRTHPPLDSVVAVQFVVNTTTSQQMVDIAKVFLRALPGLTDTGARGYVYWLPSNSFGGILIHPNSLSVESTNNTLLPVYEWVANNNGVRAVSEGSIHSTFYDMYSLYIGDLGIAIPTWLSSRLVSRQAFIENTDSLAKLVQTNNSAIPIGMNIVGGGVINGVDPNSTALNPQWRRDALAVWGYTGTWSHDTPADIIEGIKKSVTELTQRVGEVAGLDDASYLNEADPLEPKWQKAFFGSHYERLLNIKREVDPNGLFGCNRCVGFQ
ncbi:unnamed protein product [Rhizoctonia solani]|uniref:FAD-binding PCMH-type domain-containing protein n=1 Tax=Rhizoctonia solani TaxID=456999 RepID=A0A8H3CPR5_9AGAM|nr:unnamed protein product [Rhizoctonia solani]